MVAGKLAAQCIVTPPEAVTTICAGGSVTLSVTASGGTGPFTYKWEYSANGLPAWTSVANTTPAGITYSGGTTRHLTITGNGTEASVSKYYRCVVEASDCGPTNSLNAVVTTVADPNITTQPISPASICAGGTSANMIIAAAGGTPSLTYRWQYFNGSTWGDVVTGTPTGSIYSGVTGTSFSVAGISAIGTFDYRCLVLSTGDDCGTATSSTVSVTVDPVSAGGTITSNQTICFLTSPADLSLSGKTGNVVKWQKSSDSGFTTPTDIAVTSTTLAGATIGVLISNTYFRAVVKSGACSEALSSTVLVTIRSTPTAGISVSAPSTVCKNGSMPVITFTNPNASPVTITYNINGANQTTIDVGSGTTATLNAPTASAGTFVYILENVYYQDIPACSSPISGTATVTVNPLPVPTIAGPAAPRITSTGNVYTAESSMFSYVWAVSSGGSITSGSGTNSIHVDWTTTTGAKTVTVTYTNANTCTGTTVYNIDVKPLPIATIVTITGTPEVSKLLAGSYTYADGAGYDEGSSIYEWYRDVSTALSVNSKTYSPVAADEGHTLSFEVTPKSSSGIPNTGVAVKSSPTATVVSSGVPVASEVCINRVGLVLEGKYKYTFAPKAEGTSGYRWLRNGAEVGNTLTHTLVGADTANGVSLTFEVTPKSQHSVKTGVPVESYPLARFTMAEDTYSESIDTVILVANPSGGVFSGTGVTNGIFSPNAVGDSPTPYSIKYQVNIVNPSVNCSQKAYKNITVTPGTTAFGFVEDTICHNGSMFWITVETIPDGAIPYTYYDGYYDLGFYMNNYYAGTSNIGIVTEDLSPVAFINGTTPPWRVQIDPGQLSPGNGNNILYLYYYYNGYFYLLQQSLNIESDVIVTRINNISTEYCIDEPIQEISVDILYPAYADAIWTGGAILSDLNKPVAKLNPKSGTPGQKYPITYHYESQGGCLSNILRDTVTINPLPDPGFTLNDTYNIDSGAVTLIPVLHPGGSFVGNGVSANKLFPDLAGTGLDIITYSIKDENLCYNDSTQSTIIRKAQGTIVGLPPVVCYWDTTYNVTATGLPPGVTVLDFTNKKNSIVHTPLSTNASYNILAAGSGSDTLIFSYLWDNVGYAITTVVNIDSIGQVVINNLLPDDIVCANQAPFELFASPSGGVFTGPVTGGYLDPSKAMGLTSVSYKYTNIKSQCSATTVVPFKIAPAPAVAFAPADVCIENSSDTTFFLNNTVSADPVASWLWEFTDPGGSKTSTAKNPGSLYTTGSFHSVTLTATTVNKCTSSKVSTIDLGVRPLADFYWKNECFIANDSIKLFDTTFSFSSIVSRSWNFSDGGPLQYGKTTKYPKKSKGYLPVTYIVKTSYANCADTISRSVYIRPTISLATDNYFENFESGNGDWVKGEETVNNWSFGKPDRSVINSAASGSNAWYTNYDIANQKVESYSIISPCFDFSLSVRPMIMIKLFKRFSENRDGAALQYKIGDIGTWQYVGSFEDGINWYNSTLIKGHPGGEQIGWTTVGTPDTKWIESRHSLDSLKGKKNVKLRIAYGSDGTSTNNDGIAFDDISIEERTRNVLLEHFANTSSLTSSEATAMIDEISHTYDADIVNIQYHTNFPGIDSFYLDNPGDASARILFYGLTKAPYSFVDGGTNKSYANIFDYSSIESDLSLTKIDPNDVTRRSLITPAFNINLDPTNVSGGILTVGGKISAMQDIDLTNLKLYFAVIEKLDTTRKGADSETRFYNIFRKFIPDAGGINLKKTWTKGEVFTIPDETWVIEETLNSADIEVVAFIQNSVTKEMYQASSVLEPDIIVGIEKPHTGGQLDFALYPNPAESRLTIRFGEMLESVTDIYIYDYSGAIVRTYKAGSGQTEFTIDDLGLKDGIYLIKISSESANFGFKKLIIAGG